MFAKRFISFLLCLLCLQISCVAFAGAPGEGQKSGTSKKIAWKKMATKVYDVKLQRKGERFRIKLDSRMWRFHLTAEATAEAVSRILPLDPCPRCYDSCISQNFILDALREIRERSANVVVNISEMDECVRDAPCSGSHCPCEPFCNRPGPDGRYDLRYPMTNGQTPLNIGVSCDLKNQSVWVSHCEEFPSGQINRIEFDEVRLFTYTYCPASPPDGAGIIVMPAVLSDEDGNQVQRVEGTLDCLGVAPGESDVVLFEESGNTACAPLVFLSWEGGHSYPEGYPALCFLRLENNGEECLMYVQYLTGP